MGDVLGASSTPVERRLVGREQERAALETFLDHALARGGALTLNGEAGVGKTHLLREAEVLGTARGAKVLRASGVQYEAELSFGVLHQLIRSVLHRVDELPLPAASALRAALAMGSEPATRPLAVYTGVLTLFELVAEDAPVLIAIDDLQWVDASTAAVVRFLARRVDGRPIAITGTVRLGERSFFNADDVPGVVVLPLSSEDSQRLLLERFPSLSTTARRTLVEIAAGYPLALTEWGAAFEQRPEMSMDRHIETLPLPRRVESLFGSRVARLPVAARRALLLLALDGRSSLRDLIAVGLPVEDLAPAENVGAITIDASGGSIQFTHPLMRSALVSAASTTDRRRVHLSLAERLGNDPDRRAWHLAQAALGPDEAVAQLLEQVARRSFARGDAGGATATLIRAADLSPHEGERSRRLAEAAYFGADVIGERTDASELLDGASGLGAGPGSLYAAAARAQVSVNGAGDHRTSLESIEAAVNAGRHGWRADDRELVDTLRTWLFLCSYAGDESCWRAYFAALGRLTPDIPHVLRTQSSAIADPARCGPEVRADLIALASDRDICADPAILTTLATAALYLDALEPYRVHNERFVDEGRRGGAGLPHAKSLAHLSIDDVVHGRWDDALALAAEGKAICDERFSAAGSWFFAYIQAVIAASRGDTSAARESVAEIEQLCTPRGSFGAARFASQPSVLAAIADDDWEEAYRLACDVSAPGEFAHFVPVAMWVAFDLVEAALRTGRQDEARTHAAAMLAVGLPNVSGRMALLTAGADALVADEEHWADAFELAVSTPGAATWPFDLARVQLAYGERLRRSGHPVHAREMLDVALHGFEQLGARPWAMRASEELRATGDPRFRSGTYLQPSALDLTPQELATAELAAKGLTNKEIARRLFLSPRTVSGHLYNAFPKLGVTTRAALRDALNDRSPNANRPPHQ
ncbi:ATP-binding protein [Agromyces albus]|uniref:ATP-binding protein n=1 Tax=Agromyces albus TaxID=205332 RepID=UPI0027870923|nr:LuxR family transcriptional regulator [Agromyces albus]MDQ0577717.1 DNA-binding CsgD family transcriptional regulator [Agromyces albus]